MNFDDILDDDFLFGENDTENKEDKFKQIKKNIGKEKGSDILDDDMLLDFEEKNRPEEKEVITEKKRSPRKEKPVNSLLNKNMGVNDSIDQLASMEKEIQTDIPVEVAEEEYEVIRDKPATDNQLKVIEDTLGLQFSQEQKDVILHQGTALNVLSGAGSGKTTVLVAKMLYREYVHKIKPLNMLAITFSARATEEMKDRYLKARRDMGMKGRGRPTFRTFHSLFLMLLQTMKDYEKVEVMQGNRFLLNLMNMVKGGEDSDKKSILEEMFNIKGQLINHGLSTDGIEVAVENYSDEFSFQIDNYRSIMEKYKNLKELEGVIDFDDMQTILYREVVINKNKEPVEAFRRVWGEGDIYIDEYQDISEIQRTIMDELINDFSRFTVIGDDDQSIYNFRGSNPQYIIDFPYIYNKATRLHLSTNYRCKADILNPVLSSIERNKNRVPKDIKAFQPGGSIEVLPLGNNNDPLVNSILNEIEGFEGDMYKDVAILVRQNAQRMILADSLIEAGVTVDINRTQFSLQQNKVYNTVLDIIEMIKEEDNELFVKYARIMFPHIGRQEIEKYIYNDKKWYEDLINMGYYRVTEEVVREIRKVKDTNNMYNAIASVWKMVRNYYRGLAERGFGTLARTEGIVRHMLTISKGLTTMEFLSLEEKKFARIKLWCGSDEALRIDTLHSVKGLEFEIVYLVGLNADVFPNQNRYAKYLKRNGKAFADRYLEEERRLFYVGWTRAKSRLVISYNKDKPSMFLKEVTGLDIE